MRSNLRAFWKCLSQHPGVPVLFVMCLAGFVAGLNRVSLAMGFVGAAVFLAIFGPMVIVTAWTGRKRYMKNTTAPEPSQKGGAK